MPTSKRSLTVSSSTMASLRHLHFPKTGQQLPLNKTAVLYKHFIGQCTFVSQIDIVNAYPIRSAIRQLCLQLKGQLFVMTQLNTQMYRNTGEHKYKHI